MHKIVQGITVSLPDGSSKEVKDAKDSQTGQVLLDKITHMMNIPTNKRHIFGLKMYNSNEDRRWIREDVTLYEQGVHAKTQIFLLVKYLLTEDSLQLQDELGVHYAFSQAEIMVRVDKLHVSRSILPLLCALQLQGAMGDYNPDLHTIGFITYVLLDTQRSKNETLFPSGAVLLEQEILQRYRQTVGLRSIKAKLKYLQLLRSPVLVNDPMLKVRKLFTHEKVSPAIGGHFEVFAKGVSKNVLKRVKGVLVVDMEKKIVTFTKPKLLLMLEETHLTAPSVRVEKSLEDSKTLSLLNYFESLQRKERSCEITFQTNAERELFYQMVQRVRGVPEKLDVRIWVGTWNIGSAVPPPLDDWLPSTGYDLYAIGTQVRWEDSNLSGKQIQSGRRSIGHLGVCGQSSHAQRLPTCG